MQGSHHTLVEAPVRDKLVLSNLLSPKRVEYTWVSYQCCAPFFDIAKSFLIKKDRIVLHILETSYNAIRGFSLTSLDYIEVFRVSDPSYLKLKRTRLVVLEGKATLKKNKVVIIMKFTHHLNICIREDRPLSNINQDPI